MYKKPALSLTLMVCLLAQALPVTAQDKTDWTTGPLRRAIAPEAVQLAIANERTRPDVGVVQQGSTSERPGLSEYAAFTSGLFAAAPSSEAVRFARVAARTATTQAQPGKGPGWFRRHTVLSCMWVGAAAGATWAYLGIRTDTSKPGDPMHPGASTNAVAIPFGFLLGAGAGALVGVVVVLSR